MLKIKGVKKAVGDYNRANAEGGHSPRYGFLMLDRSTGEVWTDEFYSIGHNEWKEYHDSAIIDLGYIMLKKMGLKVTMANVKKAAIEVCSKYKADFFES